MVGRSGGDDGREWCRQFIMGLLSSLPATYHQVAASVPVLDHLTSAEFPSIF